MNTSLTFDVRVVCWISHCGHPGCENLIRNPDGVPVRFHCAEHRTVAEMIALVSSAIFQTSQLFAWAMSRRRAVIEARA